MTDAQRRKEEKTFEKINVLSVRGISQNLALFGKRSAEGGAFHKFQLRIIDPEDSERGFRWDGFLSFSEVNDLRSVLNTLHDAELIAQPPAWAAGTQPQLWEEIEAQARTNRKKAMTE